MPSDSTLAPEFSHCKLSEASRHFDADRLQEFIRELGEQAQSMWRNKRFFKQLLGCSHLINHGRNGIEIQV